MNKEHIPDFGLKGYVSGNVAKSSSNISRGVEGSVHCDANEMDWEEGTISASEFREDYSHEHGREVTVEFTDSPSSAQKKRSRRASAEEKVNYTKSGCHSYFKVPLFLSLSSRLQFKPKLCLLSSRNWRSLCTRFIYYVYWQGGG